MTIALWPLKGVAGLRASLEALAMLGRSRLLQWALAMVCLMPFALALRRLWGIGGCGKLR
jgi:hypothetical protein